MAARFSLSPRPSMKDIVFLNKKSIYFKYIHYAAYYLNLSPSRNKELANGNHLGVDIPDDSISVGQSEKGIDLRKEIKYGKPLRVCRTLALIKLSYTF